ncbi:MAG: cytochrome-c oxidase, cbb3-type subunit III [Burkholderiales bacterium]
MSDFTSGFWEIYIGVITIASIVACTVLLVSMSKRRVAGSQTETTGHVWDEDLGEYNNPLPRWWIWLFHITIVFGLVYLILYPGLGSYSGSYKWTSRGQYEAEIKQAESEYGALYARYATQDLTKIAADPDARAIGQKLFLNYCAQCHASDGGGSRGFPNLTDKDWLYGGEPQTIEATIMSGRNGIMPALGQALGDEGTRDVAHYVLSLSGRTHDSMRAARGKQTFTTICAACHGADGKGNQQLGAPNLTDNIWLHGSSEAIIVETITKGRNSVMPAHRDFLGGAKVHILAAYVYSLSQPLSVGAPSNAADK